MSFKSKYSPLLVTVLFVAVLLFLSAYQKEQSAKEDATSLEQLQDEINAFTEIRNRILDRCVEDVDPKDLLYSAFKGMAKAVPYCYFYTPEEQSRLDEAITGNTVGLGLLCSRVNGKLIVDKVIHRSEAHYWFSPGDEILEIEGTPAKNLTLKEVKKMLRGNGEEGTICNLLVRKKKSGNVYPYDLKREVLKLPTVLGGDLVDEQYEIGYIRIAKFANRTDNEFLFVLNRLKDKCQSLILDLRFNGGGVLESALNIANVFISEGVLVSTRGRTKKSNRVYEANPKRCINPDLKLVVLVNGESASASEVLAGTLQDHKRAVILGNQTFGKGVVQRAFKKEYFGEPTILKIPTALYYLPSGRSIDKKYGKSDESGYGLEPDIVLPLTTRTLRELKKYLELQNFSLGISEEEDEKERKFLDPQLKAAIRLLRGEAIATPLSGNDEDK